MLQKISKWLARGSRNPAPVRNKASMSPADLWMRGASSSVFLAEADAQAFEKSAIVYACVSKRARDIARCPLVVLRDKDDKESVVQPSDPLSRLLQQPCGFMSTYQWVEYLVTVFSLRGEAFIVPDDYRSPTELIPIYDPLYWRESTDARGMLVGWMFRAGQASFTVPNPRSIIHLKTTCLSRPHRGQSPLTAAAESFLIETYGDTFKRSVLQNGGETPAIFKAEDTLQDEQYQQLMVRLASRKSAAGAQGRDWIIDGNLELLDPKLTRRDLELLANQEMAADKICYAFGMSMALIGRDSAANYVDTFRRRQQIYWQETLIPIMRTLEDGFDQFFTSGPMMSGLYVRFDVSKVDALQQELGTQLDNAKKMHGLGVPLTVINERLGLELPVEQIPGADEVMVPVGAAPYSAVASVWSDDPGDNDDEKVARPTDGSRPAGTPSPPRAGHPPVAKAEMLARAKDVRAVIQRRKRMAKLEAGVARTWKLKVRDIQKAAVAIAKQTAISGATAQNVASALPGKLSDLRAKARETLPAELEPYHVRAAGEGALSIQHLLGKIEIDDADVFLKAPILSQAAKDVIKDRQNLIRGMADDLFDNVMDRVNDAVVAGIQASEIATVVADAMNVSVNRAVTIGRTEVGTAYNASRFTEMGEQGFEMHEWMANDDDRVRDTHLESEQAGPIKVGDVFPCGLRYPMEPGGTPENVINCRCETIPYVA